MQKMSKSLNNYVGIDDSPDEMFGKIMSVSDDLMWRYFELLSFRPLSEIEKFKYDVAEGSNPRDIKFLLAEELIARFHDVQSAQKARQNFIDRFAKGAIPNEIPELTLKLEGSTIGVAVMLQRAGLTSSNSESFRMIQQGAVKLDGEKVEDKGLNLDQGKVLVAQIGKRKFARITLA